MKNNKIAYIYYFVIIMIMAIWDGIGVEVPMMIRIAFLGITFIPLLNRKDLFPAVFVSTVTISQNAFTSPLFPTSTYFFVIILFIFAIASALHRFVLPPFVFILSYVLVSLTDLIQQEALSYVSTKILMCLLAFVIIKGNKEKSREHISYAFMIIAIVLSYWTLLRPDAHIVSYHNTEGFDSVEGWTDPNYLSSMIALGCMVAINELLNNREKGVKLLFCTTTVVFSLFSMAFLASRGAIVALAVGSAVLLLFSAQTKKAYKLLFVVLATALIVFMYQTSYFDLAIARFQEESLYTGTNRTEIWGAKLHSFFTELNPFECVFGISHDKGLLLGHFGRPRAFHNDFIAVLCEYGFAGLILFVYTLFRIIKRINREYIYQVGGLLATYVTVALTLEPSFSDMPSSIVFMFFLFYLLLFTREKRTVQ